MPSNSLGKSRQSAYTVVRFPTVPSIKLQPTKIDLIEERGMHDLLTLQFSIGNPLWIKTLRTGVPIEVNITQGPYARNWVGYVSSVTTHTAGQLQELMEVHCIGPTFPLKERVSRVFVNQSIPSIVKTIVEEFGFKFYGEDNGIVFDQVIIANHSYWEWIQEQARKIGYGVMVDGLTFMFRPLDELIHAGVTSLPTFTMFGKGTGINNMQEDRTLDWMQVYNGEYVEYGNYVRSEKTTGGVNPKDVGKVSASANPKLLGVPTRANVGDVLFSHNFQEHVSSSASIAKLLAEGAAHHSRFSIPGKLKGQGDPRVRLYNPIAVVGTSDLNDGIWIVHKAVHHFSSNHNYQVDLDIATDGNGTIGDAYVRITENSIAGVVNLTEALNNGGQNPNATNHNSYTLKVLTELHSELNQGWARTPATWVYARK